MARSEFSVFSRKGKNEKTTFCVRFFDDAGRVKKTVSMPQARSRTAAGRLAEKLLGEGVVPNALNPDCIGYLLSFWKSDSPYVKGRALRGRGLSPRYLANNIYSINKHLVALKGLRILDVSPKVLEELILDLSGKGVSPRVVNCACQALRVSVAHFCRMNRIPNTLPSVERLSENPKPRGILSADEMKRIIALEGESPRVKAAVLLAGLCGLRLGEVRGLQWDDIQDGIIHVVHNCVDVSEGCKGPKHGSVRDVPAPKPVMDALEACQATRPANAGVYVLWNDIHRGKPVCGFTLRAGFYRVLEKIGIGEVERDARNVLFHGLRHTFVSLSRSAGVSDFIIQSMAGHSTMAMTDRYSHVSVVDFQKARAAMESAVSGKAASV